VTWATFVAASYEKDINLGKRERAQGLGLTRVRRTMVDILEKGLDERRVTAYICKYAPVEWLSSAHMSSYSLEFSAAVKSRSGTFITHPPPGTC